MTGGKRFSHNIFRLANFLITMHTFSLVKYVINYKLSNLLIASYDVDSVGTDPLL